MKIYPVLFVTVSTALLAQNTRPPTEGGCQIFPADNIWNTRIDKLPVDPNSAAYINSAGASTPLHPDFGTVYQGAPNGLPFVVVPSNQPNVPIVFTAYGSESDPGPYPVPPNAPVEGGLTSTGDRHVGVLQSGTCKLYEMFSSYPQSDGSWQAASGALFDLTVNAPLRPAGWTSADAAGLPIFPGLVRYDDVQQALAADGVLHHALRFTFATTRASYLWPARHFASTSNSLAYPPMGQRFRLKASTNIDVYPGTTTPVSATNKVILQTLKTYGMFVADNGGSFHVVGAPDPSWDDGDLHLITYYTANDFEAVDESSLMIDPNSGQAVQSTTLPSPTISLTAPANQATVSGTVTITAQAQAAAGISSVKFLLDGSTSLGTLTGAGPNFSVSWSTSSASNGSHSLSAVVVDAQGISVTSNVVSVTVANSTGSTPTTFTTYLSPYGSTFQTLSGNTVVLPLRGYIPGGAAQLTFLTANLNATATGTSEYEIIAETDGATGYTLRITNGITSAPWPDLEMQQSASMITLATPISVNTLQITGYRFALVGNEFQLDLAATRSGTFDDQIVIRAVAGSTYSSPWSASAGEWKSSGSTGSPVVTLSSTSLAFGTQSVGNGVSQNLKLTNSGSAPLSLSSVQVGGANTSDFSANNGCPSSVAAGSSCNISVTFDPTTTGARSATLSISDNASGTPQTVSLTGTGSTVATPTTFTTYLSPYGSGAQTIVGNSALLPLRGYIPGGASQFTFLIASLNATTSGTSEYEVIAESDGVGGYTLRITNGVTYAPPWPNFEMTQSPNMITLTSPITLGTMQITGYRFTLASNEFQLDLAVTRTGTFSDQIVILGVSGSNYSSPWGASDGLWIN